MNGGQLSWATLGSGKVTFSLISGTESGIESGSHADTSGEL